MKSIFAPIPTFNTESIQLSTVIANDVRQVRQAQKRAEDAFMALPLTIPHAQFIGFADALETLCIITDIAFLTAITEEMQDVTENHDKMKAARLAALEL